MSTTETPDAPTPDAPDPAAESGEAPDKFNPNVHVPPRSRTFTEDDARAVLALLNGEDVRDRTSRARTSATGRSRRQARRARQASRSTSCCLTSGAPHKYAITTFERGGKIVGVLLNKPAKQKTTPAATPAPAAAAPRSGGRRRR
jgi:hypothetical protein